MNDLESMLKNGENRYLIKIIVAPSAVVFSFLLPEKLYAKAKWRVWTHASNILSFAQPSHPGPHFSPSSCFGSCAAKKNLFPSSIWSKQSPELDIREGKEKLLWSIRLSLTINCHSPVPQTQHPLVTPRHTHTDTRISLRTPGVEDCPEQMLTIATESRAHNCLKWVGFSSHSYN